MWTCEHRATSDGHQTFSGKVLSHSIFYDQLAAGHFHWRQEFSVGQLRQYFHLAANAGEILYVDAGYSHAVAGMNVEPEAPAA